MKIIKRATAVFVAAVLLISMCASAFAEEYHMLDPYVMTVFVNGQAFGVRAYDSNYENNVYLSLRDVSAVLNGTEKQFSLKYGSTTEDGDFYSIMTGQPFAGEENGITQTDPNSREQVWLAFKRSRVFFNGADRKYYTYREGGNDLYMDLTDIQLMLDMTARYEGENTLRFYPNSTFSPSMYDLAAEGYFDCINSFVLGDATTGSILYSMNSEGSFGIASISKLMIYLLYAEAEKRGEISDKEQITISEHVEKVSNSADGIIKMEAGEAVPVDELLNAMLIASSNESASAIAERLFGSERACIERMNARAAELGLKTARFYTTNGLPYYSESTVPGKMQNRMSARELFKLSSYILANFPQITEITAKQFSSMPTLEYTSANSNPLVFNMPGVTGLKTGTTNRAGNCLAVSMPLSINGETHNIVLIILGSENGADRGRQSEILMRCARDYYLKNGFELIKVPGR